MPKSLGNCLPETLHDLFAGDDLEAGLGLTFLLLTVDAEGWPHMAMLSVGELLLVDERTLRTGLWLHSTATTNLTRERRGVLSFVYRAAGYTLRFQARRQPDLDLGEDGRLAGFTLTIEDVLEDVVNYAELTSGITFRLYQPEQVLPRWQRTIQALRKVAA